jgi:hypothetical protein
MEVDQPVRTAMSLVLVAVLVVVGSAWSCNSASITSWLTLASQDLPILEQEAQNIIAISDPGDLALVTQLSNGISASLTLVTDAISAYQANPSATKLQAIAAALAKASTDLPALLAALPISDPTVKSAIIAAVGAIVVTLDILASQLPSAASTAAQNQARAQRMAARIGPLPDISPTGLKASWNTNVCGEHLGLAHCPQLQ